MKLETLLYTVLIVLAFVQEERSYAQQTSKKTISITYYRRNSLDLQHVSRYISLLRNTNINFIKVSEAF